MKSTLDFETQLHAVPVRNEKLKVTAPESKPDALVVEVELRYRGLIGSVASLVGARDRKRYELVGLSRELFELLDGKRTVEHLVDWLCEQDCLTFLEGRALIVQYLRDLMRRGLVVVLADDSTGDGA